jgi:hypothetical protein
MEVRQLCWLLTFFFWKAKQVEKLNQMRLLKFISPHILKFEFFQISSDGEMIKTKVVDVKKLYTFVVDNFFI